MRVRWIVGLALLTLVGLPWTSAQGRDFDAQIEVSPRAAKVVDGQTIELTFTIKNTGSKSWSYADPAKAPQLGYGSRGKHKEAYREDRDVIVVTTPLVRDHPVLNRIDIWQGRQEIKPGETMTVKVSFKVTKKQPNDSVAREVFQLVWDSGAPSAEWRDGWVGNTASVTCLITPAQRR